MKMLDFVIMYAAKMDYNYKNNDVVIKAKLLDIFWKINFVQFLDNIRP